MQTVKHLLEHKAAQVLSVSAEDSVLHAIGVMAKWHVGALLVMQGDKLLGVLSERDYARKVILNGRSSHDTTVAQIMSSPVISVGPDDTNTGRWIPTTSIDQYFATLATWFGVDAGNLETVFPNLNRFLAPNLGFV